MIGQFLSIFPRVSTHICRLSTSAKSSTSNINKIPADKENSATRPTFIYFATATTGFSYRFDAVIQIAAIKQGEEKPFNIFIKPRIDISKKATDKHGITYTDNVMKLHDGTKVTPILREKAVEVILQYLKSSPNPTFITHHATFHFQILYALLNKTVENSTLLSLLNISVVDSEALFRSLYPVKQKNEHKLANYQLKTIATYILGDDYKFNAAHDAISHVLILKDIFEKMSLPDNQILQHAKPFQNIVNAMKFRDFRSVYAK